jgi:MerR family transcriptional regulator, gold-responsive activator of gol and ges genes
MEPLNIGQAATAAGVSAKMIRHYEGIGLIPKAKRTYSGYRTYSDNEIHVLRFIRHARSLGFSIKQIGELVGLWQDRRRPSSRVKNLAMEHIRELDQKIVQMQAMKATLERLAVHCHGDDRPECPILDELALPDGA